MRKNIKLIPCSCGVCGEFIPERDRQGKKHFYKKGHFHKGKKVPEISERQKGDKNPYWKGGIVFDKQSGYTLERCEGHPRAKGAGCYVPQHILVMERHMSKLLGYKFFMPSWMVVHHINGEKTDNRIDNLKLMSWGEHTSLHHKGILEDMHKL